MPQTRTYTVTIVLPANHPNNVADTLAEETAIANAVNGCEHFAGATDIKVEANPS